jgi:hypothetical protein
VPEDSCWKNRGAAIVIDDVGIDIRIPGANEHKTSNQIRINCSMRDELRDMYGAPFEGKQMPWLSW